MGPDSLWIHSALKTPEAGRLRMFVAIRFAGLRGEVEWGLMTWQNASPAVQQPRNVNPDRFRLVKYFLWLIWFLLCACLWLLGSAMRLGAPGTLSR
jgi:hypothetical protein